MDYLERMKAELAELSEKLAKLVEYNGSDVFTDRKPMEQELMVQQACHMANYEYVLKMRIRYAEEA